MSLSVGVMWLARNWAEWFKRPMPPALTKIWVLQTTWTDLSVELQEIVSGLWRNRELGNDNYIYKTSCADLAEMQEEGITAEKWYWGETEEEKRGWVEEPLNLQPLIDYLEEKGVGNEEVWLHLWR